MIFGVGRTHPGASFGRNCGLLHISAHKGPFGSIQSMMIMAHCGASCITQVSGFY